jgi:hypothetical protein
LLSRMNEGTSGNSLHQRLMGEQVVRRFRCPVLPDIAGACN